MLYRRDRGKVSTKTLEENRNFWKRFLQDEPITKRPVCDLTVKQYIEFFENLTKDGTYTSKCIGNLKSLLNKMYDYAIREEIVEFNPLKNIDFREFNYYIPFNDDKVYKNEERLRLLNHLQDIKEPYALAIRLMFQLTCRIGEIKSFRWDDVDFSEKTICVTKQALTNRKLNDDMTFASRETVVVNHTKKNTPQGKRKLRLTNEAVSILQSAKEINPDGEYVFMPKGKLMLTDTFNEHLKKYCNECNVPYYSSHKIRFTSASNLYNGKNLTQVSRALGHSQVATTLHYFRNVACDDDLLEQMETAFSVK
jgi:integrase